MSRGVLDVSPMSPDTTSRCYPPPTTGVLPMYQDRTNVHPSGTGRAIMIYAQSIVTSRTPRKARKRHVQQELRLSESGSRRGGKRKRAGRKPKVVGAPGVSHRARPLHSAKHPVHVTLRVCRDVPNLRRNAFLPVLTDALRAGNDRFGFRLCHYVVMGNHLHLIVEAEDARALARGMQGLSIRLARRVNVAARRSGKFFADRYHAHVLRTPTEVHRALSYVLLNLRKHASEHAGRPPEGLDAFSSGAWFDGWHTPPPSATRLRGGEAPVTRPQAWLLREGWKKAGIISPH
jgi:REP element-mobilizing transposase RayT